ncbi:MAG: CHASE domain-containing protein, partial [Ilumatobacteraceae bacterium]
MILRRSPGRETPGSRPTDADVGAGWSLPRAFGRGMVSGVVLAILVVGFGATVMLYREAQAESRHDERDLALRASRVLEESSNSLAAALAGASSIVGPSGEVEPLIFETYASGAVESTDIAMLAYVPLVPAEQRSAFEREAGLTITERGANGLISAESRPEYMPVQYVFPVTDTSRSVIGFDTASEPTRLATSNTARDAASLVFSGPVPSQPSGQTSFFFAQPLYQPGAPIDTIDQRRSAIVGFASGLTPSATLLTSILDTLPAGVKVSILDDGIQLASTADAPSHGQRMDIVQGGRTWTIILDYESADLQTTWLLLIATLVLAACVAAFLLRNVHQTRDLRAAALNVRQLGQLSELLAVGDEGEQMVRSILTHASSTVGADAARIALRSTGRLPDQVIVMTAARRQGDRVFDTAEDVPVDRSTSIGIALIDDQPLFRSDGASTWAGKGAQASAALPLRRPSGEPFGVIEWAWSRPNRFGAGLRATLLATAEVCQQSLYRAEVQAERWRSASSLSELSQRLSVARTLGEISETIVRLGAESSGADRVAVGFINDAGTELRLFHSSFDAAPGAADLVSFQLPVDPGGTLMAVLKRGQPIRFDDAADLDRFPAIHELVGSQLLRRVTCLPLIDADHQLRGVIAFVYMTGSERRPAPEAGRLDTIADLTAQTVERSLLYQHEHELILNLQRQTLGELPQIAGMQLAARYLPASSVLGLGGDWYDVYLLDDGRIGIVVGDVAGHGIDAIADMTEFRTTISTLLRTDPELAGIPAMSTKLLNG